MEPRIDTETEAGRSRRSEEKVRFAGSICFHLCWPPRSLSDSASVVDTISVLPGREQLDIGVGLRTIYGQWRSQRP